ncbi:hypothetical protein ABIF61_001046 [Bradyrhizobium japonicum]|uniref:hypothetical protein n=1 Tax=Bradyrhizobium ottawaense TaxID=931866 RepID=UPI0034916D94
MRHHAEDVGVAVLVENFAGAVGCLGRVAVVDAGHDFPEVFPDFLMLFVVVRASSQRLYSREDAGATLSSQIAAALLIDPDTVDIRRVGTNHGEYSQMGCSE